MIIKAQTPQSALDAMTENLQGIIRSSSPYTIIREQFEEIIKHLSIQYNFK